MADHSSLIIRPKKILYIHVNKFIVLFHKIDMFLSVFYYADIFT